MLKELESLEKSRIVVKYEVLDFKEGGNFYFLKLKVQLIDGSILYVREYVSEEDYIYSFHWQDDKGKLRIRWDNAPYHKNVRTFPHHKLTDKGVEGSHEITLEDVLRVIENKITSKDNVKR